MNTKTLPLKQKHNLEGKEYFTVDEAAHFACVSTSHFRAKAPDLGLKPFKYMGRLVYRRTDLQKSMEAQARVQWRQRVNASADG